MSFDSAKDAGKDIQLSVSAYKVLERRYLQRDRRGKVTETPRELFDRVAGAVASADARLEGKAAAESSRHRFFSMMARLKFLPNSPCLMNAGTSLGQLSACFVIPVEDSLESIFDAVKKMALVQQSGGGTGFNFSRIRPRGSVVDSTRGAASGPVSFMEIFDKATDVVRQGGRRRGANMAVLNVDHPDVLEFARAKEDQGILENFNLSVAVTDAFLGAVRADSDWELKNPATGRCVRQVSARALFDEIVGAAWKSGDPGLIFIDAVNRANPTPGLGPIDTTNPCGEQPLLPYESCTLGSVNLAKFGLRGSIDWDGLKETVRHGVHFLDNVIEVSRLPLPELARATLGNRKIGLGVMGWADLLIELGLAYDSDEAVALADRVMGFIAAAARERSEELGQTRGSFPNFKESVFPDQGVAARRNATVTTIAPTGTISIIAGCSSGIEPLFGIAYVRNILGSARFPEINQSFVSAAKNAGFYSEELTQRIGETGSLKDVGDVPPNVKRVFVTAHDIEPAWHVRMQAAFQNHVDNATSKTVNLPSDAGPTAVREVFEAAYDQKCKGVTVYRYGSKGNPVLEKNPMTWLERREDRLEVGPEYAGGCPGPDCVY